MGVLITRGSRISVPAGGLTLSIGPDGSPIGSLTLHVSYDMYPQWLKIAIEQAERCAEAAKVVDRLWIDGSRTEETEALETELRAGMQACLAAAAAIDGFYGTVRDLGTIPSEVSKTWRHKKLARYKQIAETIRLSFDIGPKVFADVRPRLEMLFMFRDEAVHPTGATREPAPHPRVKVATERRLAMYSADNAHSGAKFALNLIGILLDLPKPKHAALVEHCQAAKEWVHPILDLWEAKHGQLFERKIVLST
jgi:hypothetical protein